MKGDFLFSVSGTKKDEEMIYDKAAMGLAISGLPRNFYANEGMGLKLCDECSLAKKKQF